MSAPVATSEMTDEVADAVPPAPVPSPCVNVCCMEPEAPGGVAVCAGCLRTIDEIAAWSQLSETDKRGVWAAIETRRRQRADASVSGDTG